MTTVPTVKALHMMIGHTGVKWPRREADHSPSSSAGVKNKWSYIVELVRNLVAHGDAREGK